MSLTSRLKKKFLSRKPRPWHLTSAEIEAIDNMPHEQLVDFCVKQKEQANRIVRAIVKLKQALTEITAAGD